jgi:hypothetical protein
VVTLEDEPWPEVELDWFEDEEPLEVEPLDVDESFDEDPLVFEESFELEPLELEESSDDEPAEDDVPEVVIALDEPLVPACFDAAVAVVLAPRYPVAAIVPKTRAKVAMAAAATRRRIFCARRARARRRSRTSSEFEVGGWLAGMGAS